MLRESQWHLKTLCLAVQVRGEKFWLSIKTKSAGAGVGRVGWHSSQPHWHCGAEEGAVRAVVHRSIPVWLPTVPLGVKPLWCRAGVFSLRQLLGVLSHQVLLSLLYLLKLEKQKGVAASQLLVSQWQGDDLSPISHTWRHLSVSQFTAQCFKRFQTVLSLADSCKKSEVLLQWHGHKTPWAKLPFLFPSRHACFLKM